MNIIIEWFNKYHEEVMTVLAILVPVLLVTITEVAIDSKVKGLLTGLKVTEENKAKINSTMSSTLVEIKTAIVQVKDNAIISDLIKDTLKDTVSVVSQVESEIRSNFEVLSQGVSQSMKQLQDVLPGFKETIKKEINSVLVSVVGDLTNELKSIKDELDKLRKRG